MRQSASLLGILHPVSHRIPQRHWVFARHQKPVDAIPDQLANASGHAPALTELARATGTIRSYHWQTARERFANGHRKAFVA